MPTTWNRVLVALRHGHRGTTPGHDGQASRGRPWRVEGWSPEDTAGAEDQGAPGRRRTFPPWLMWALVQVLGELPAR